MAIDEDDTGTIEEIDAGVDEISHEVDTLEVKLTLSGEYDRGNAIVTIKPGAGGTESQDWAQMLFRMYMRFAEKSGFKTTVIDFQPGEEAGLKSATITVNGEYGYGYMKAEEGVHRLVRISPFDSNKRRHTSFASVVVLPELNEDVIVEIDEGDLRVDTYRASGAGGQHVNKTDSAVRITHAPTGIVVQCQSERSQHKNKATAMKILKARLFEVEEKKNREKIDSMSSEKKEIGFGSQIRSYVLQPYRMVKDLRTNIETSNTDAVLDGDIMPFIEAFLSSGANRPDGNETENNSTNGR
jgi:peptide chain release factor 2